MSSHEVVGEDDVFGRHRIAVLEDRISEFTGDREAVGRRIAPPSQAGDSSMKTPRNWRWPLQNLIVAGERGERCSPP